MDFIEPETEILADSTETLKAKPTAIESSMEKIYDDLEAKGKQGWSSFNGFLSTFQKNMPEYINQTKTKLEQTKQQLEQLALNEEEGKPKIEPKKILKNITSVTNEYLDELDDDLQKIETAGLGYAAKLGSLIKEAIQVQPPTDEYNGDETLDQSEVLFGVPEGVHSSRAEVQLHELRSSAELYTKPVDNEEEYAKFEYDSKLSEELLAKFPNLQTVFDAIVPAKLSAEEFWKRYFYEQGKIVKEEQRRKQLLERTNENEDEDFDWDDDEDENTKKDQDQVQKASESTTSDLSLQSASSSTLEVVGSRKKTEDDEDDDWE